MNLINKLRMTFGIDEDTPEIIEDMYAGNTSALDVFHAELGILSEKNGTCYFEAFVEYINGADLNTSNRSELEQYLSRKGLCLTDIKQLVDELYGTKVK